MLIIPRLKHINTDARLKDYAKNYEQASGFKVPFQYFKSSSNKVYCFEVKGKMIGGFILGQDTNFRTISVFVQEKNQDKVLDLLEEATSFTELTCFWMDRSIRCNTFINIMVWLHLSIKLQQQPRQYILFGTNSKGLARLYNQTPRTVLIHQDAVNQKNTYVFVGQRKDGIQGILGILASKVKRMIQIKLNQPYLKQTPQLRPEEQRSISSIF